MNDNQYVDNIRTDQPSSFMNSSYYYDHNLDSRKSLLIFNDQPLYSTDKLIHDLSNQKLSALYL